MPKDNKLISVDPETHKRLKQYAAETDRTLGGSVAALLKEHYSKTGPKPLVLRNPTQTDI